MAYTPPVVGSADWGPVLNTALDDIDTTAEAAQATADGKADAVHTHDDRYFTEAEVTSSLAGKSDTSHTHDTRYFTEAETTSLLAGKANTSHVHAQSDVTGLTTALAGKANTSHTHSGADVTSGTVDIARLPASLPRGVMAAPIGTTSNGTATSGTTETRDTVLGVYTFTATAGRRYKVILSGRAMNTSVAAERYEFRIRMTTDGTTPDATDTCVATAQNYLHENSNIGRMSAHLEGTFTASGTCKLACFMVRLDGATGSGTPVSTGVAGVGAELWVEDIGPA